MKCIKCGCEYPPFQWYEMGFILPNCTCDCHKKRKGKNYGRQNQILNVRNILAGNLSLKTNQKSQPNRQRNQNRVADEKLNHSGSCCFFKNFPGKIIHKIF